MAGHAMRLAPGEHAGAVQIRDGLARAACRRPRRRTRNSAPAPPRRPWPAAWVCRSRAAPARPAGCMLDDQRRQGASGAARARLAPGAATPPVALARGAPRASMSWRRCAAIRQRLAIGRIDQGNRLARGAGGVLPMKFSWEHFDRTARAARVVAPARAGAPVVGTCGQIAPTRRTHDDRLLHLAHAQRTQVHILLEECGLPTTCTRWTSARASSSRPRLPGHQPQQIRSPP